VQITAQATEALARTATVRGMGSYKARHALAFLRNRSLIAKLEDGGKTLVVHVPEGLTDPQVDHLIWQSFGFPQVLSGWVEFKGGVQ
jgi:hypothetical protein